MGSSSVFSRRPDVVIGSSRAEKSRVTRLGRRPPPPRGRERGGGGVHWACRGAPAFANARSRARSRKGRQTLQRPRAQGGAQARTRARARTSAAGDAREQRVGPGAGVCAAREPRGVGTRAIAVRDGHPWDRGVVGRAGRGPARRHPGHLLGGPVPGPVPPPERP